MHRFYADAEGEVSPGIFQLSKEDSHHALNVLRLKKADQVELITDGQRFLSVIRDIAENAVSVQTLSPLPSTEPGLRIVLLQGLPKGDKMEWIVQKAVELGGSAIVPVAMTRCIVRLDQRDGEKKAERWQKIAREAGKQSGRCRIPEVHAPVRFHELAGITADLDAVIVPWELSRDHGPKAFCQEHPDLHSLGILIGPEGGITEEEMEALRRMGCESVTLGKRILRTETAGIAAISAIMALYGEME